MAAQAAEVETARVFAASAITRLGLAGDSVGVALRMIGEDLPYVPLYRRTLTWAMAKKLSAVQ